MSQGLGLFEEAIRIDPRYAAGYAGLADSYCLLGYYGMLLSPEAAGQARPAALKAVELDPELSEAHAALALVRMLYDWDWRGAESEFDRALELNPGNADARNWRASLLVILGRAEEGLKEAERSRQQDPLSLNANAGTADLLFQARRYDEAIARFQKTIEMDPAYLLTYEGLADTYEAKGDHAAAFEAYRKWASVAGLAPSDVARLETAYRSGGMPAYWRTRLALETEEEREAGQVWVFRRAQLHARIGDHAGAMEWLEKAYAERHNRLILLNVHPVFDGLRSEPAFQDLVRRVGLPAAR